MTDQFASLDLGDPLDSNKIKTMVCLVVTAAVVKGQIVDLTHVATAVPKVSTASASSLIAKGVVMAALNEPDETPYAVGTKVLIGYGGIFKVKAGSNGATAGKLLAVDTSYVAGGAGVGGCVTDTTTASQVIGKAIQTGAQNEGILADIY